MGKGLQRRQLLPDPRLAVKGREGSNTGGGDSKAGLREMREHVRHVNPKKDSTCQEGLLVVNGAQIHNQSLAVIADRPLKHTAFQGKTTD